MSRRLFELDYSEIPVSGSDAAFPVRRIYCIGR
ncbi:MAG TPA: FAA hydrolase family protein, partial [Xanthobacteraceae bacterium]|nr:FAA hydrolase family protein [Xanthobacteraceae bacterium]